MICKTICLQQFYKAGPEFALFASQELGAHKSVKPQAVVVSPLSLLILWISFANDVECSLSLYNSTVLAYLFNG